MARRRNPFGTGTRSRGGAAPAAIKFKAPTLDLAGLQSAYDWMVVDKDLGIRLAFEWYATAVPTLLATNFDAATGKVVALTPDQQKKFDRATLCRNQADGTPYEQERATFAAKSLRLYEEIWPGKNLPKIDVALAATTPGQHVQHVQTVLGNLNAAYGSFGVEFKLTFGADRVASENKILLPIKEVDDLIARPAIKSVLGEALAVAKTAAVTVDAAGKRSIDGAKFMANLPLVLAAAGKWAATAANASKPVGKAAKAVKSTGGRAPAIPRAAGACRVKLTSPKIAKLADMLKAGATSAQIIAAIPGWNPDSVKWYINETAKALGGKAKKIGDVWHVVS